MNSCNCSLFSWQLSNIKSALHFPQGRKSTYCCCTYFWELTTTPASKIFEPVVDLKHFSLSNPVTKMDHISIVDVACQTIISIKCVEPPPAPVVETMIKYVFPALEHVPFSLSLKVAGECYEPYEPHLSQAPHSIFLHRPGDVTADVDRGSRVFCEMIKSRAGTSHKYKSHKRSGASTPNSSVSNVCDLGDAVTEVLNNWDARDGIQSAMRDCCLQRDQVCVITGIVTAAHIECAHILKPAYAMTWFSQDSRWDKYCANFPIVAGRSSPAMDVRNGVMMSKSLRAAFDNFEFSIYPEGDQV
ncbi:hypothetical protein BC832DRAFT_550883 [Gaertneriomyces semiglobifer]|nr:hypothetical protein BC832DRAFT_550883 [Gaertneriomyces semiglobifer]